MHNITSILFVFILIYLLGYLRAKKSEFFFYLSIILQLKPYRCNIYITHLSKYVCMYYYFIIEEFSEKLILPIL